MEIEILKQEKDEIEFKIDNLTVAEILRNYLNKQGIEFVAWRREHPSKPVIMRIQVSSGTVNKAVGEAIAAIKKDLAAMEKGLKK
jgi:DNA-directed RNA polymerase subunit L